MERAPDLDPRSPAELRRELASALAARLPELSDVDPETGAPAGGAAAMIAAFGRLAEILVDRLNRAPDRNLLAFLDLLGASRVPPRAARTPLAFALAPGGPGQVTVPERTRVAAEPPESGGPPPVFETERPLEVVAADLDRVHVREPATDRYASAAPVGGLLADAPVLFRGDAATAHHLYVRQDRLLSSPSRELRLEVEQPPGRSPRDRREVRWEVWDGAEGIPLEASDGTDGLRTSGVVTFQDVPVVPERAVNGVRGRWLRCVLETPVAGGATPRAGMVRDRELPRLRRIGMRQELGRGDVAVTAAFANAAPLDPTMDFFPFGESPGFGDTFYLSGDDAFSEPSTRVTLKVALTNPASGGDEPPIPRAAPTPDLRLRWEAWNGERWEELGTSRPDTGRAGPNGFKDTTRAFGRDGEVTFVLPSTTASTEVNGVAGYWIRARIQAGGYGIPPGYRSEAGGDGTEHRFHPGTLAPPSVRELAIDVAGEREAASPDAALGYNDFTWTDGTGPLREPGGSWRPFHAMQDGEPALYLGFRARGEADRLPGRSLSLWVGLGRRYGDPASPGRPDANIVGRPDAGIAGRPAGAGSEDGTAQGPGWRVEWQYRGSGGWTRATLQDDTDGLRRSGALRFLVPADLVPRRDFGVRRHWLRAVLVDPDRAASYPTLEAVLHNAVWASHASTVREETLGSSDGTPGQRVRTRLAPVLPGQRLLVREGGRDAAGGDAGGEGVDGWVEWRQVADFHGSGPADRHYVLDRMSGEIRFGDGRSGAVPPAGRDNLRMARYRTGGGQAGNVAADTVSRLQTSVPYVEAVTNPRPARGGADAEDLDSVRRRAPRRLRHRDRAVTAGDYVALARDASSRVARATCLPERGVAPESRPRVRIVVVPASGDPAPRPDEALLAQVTNYLGGRCPPAVSVGVCGPEYARVDVEATLAVASPDLAAEVEGAARGALERFLHPLTGGRAGTGWPFGVVPGRSDLQALLASVSGVDHLVSVELVVEDPGDRGRTGASLVRSGTHRIHLTAGRGPDRVVERSLDRTTP